MEEKLRTEEIKKVTKEIGEHQNKIAQLKSMLGREEEQRIAKMGILQYLKDKLWIKKEDKKKN